MRKRQLIAAALLGLGMIVCFGTVGDAYLRGMWADEYYIRSGIGMTLCFAAVPVSGTFHTEKNKPHGLTRHGKKNICTVVLYHI